MYAPSFMERLAFPRRDTCFCAYPSFPQSVRRTRICTGPAAVVSFCSSFLLFRKAAFSCSMFCIVSSCFLPSIVSVLLSAVAVSSGASRRRFTTNNNSSRRIPTPNSISSNVSFYAHGFLSDSFSFCDFSLTNTALWYIVRLCINFISTSRVHQKKIRLLVREGIQVRFLGDPVTVIRE